MGKNEAKPKSLPEVKKLDKLRSNILSRFSKFSAASKHQKRACCVLSVVTTLLCLVVIVTASINFCKIISPESENDKINQTLQTNENTAPSQLLTSLYEEFTKSTTTPGCSLSSYTFTSPFIVKCASTFSRPVLSLRSATACMWVKSSQPDSDFVFFTYAVNNDVRVPHPMFAFHIGYHHDRSSLSLVVNNYGWTYHDLLANITDMNHICAWFDSRSRGVGAFVNGQASAPSYYVGGKIPSNGSLYLGRQTINIAPQHWKPERLKPWTIENAMMWPRVLNESEITQLRQGCVCPTGRVYATSIENMKLSGDVTHKTPSNCRTAD